MQIFMITLLTADQKKQKNLLAKKTSLIIVTLFYFVGNTLPL